MPKVFWYEGRFWLEPRAIIVHWMMTSRSSLRGGREFFTSVEEFFKLRPMPLYRYIAATAERSSSSGVITADSPVSARQRLRENGLTILHVEESHSAEQNTGWTFVRRRRPHQVSMVIRELATLAHAGIPLTDALATLIRQHDGATRQWLMQIMEDVQQGQSLAAAMERQQGVFDRLAVDMVRVGESAGNLEEVLSILAEFSEKSLSFRNRLFSALLYPVLVFFAAISVSVFLMTSVVPMLLASLVEAGQELPLPTRILKTASDLLLKYGTVGALGLFIGVVAAAWYVRTPAGQYRWHRRLLTLPLIGGMAFRQTMSRSAYVICTLLRSGIDLPQAIHIAAQSCQNRHIAVGLERVEEAIHTGQELGPAFEQTTMFPPLVIQIFAVGQQSGQLEAMLEQLSLDYDRQVETLSTRLATALEPITIVFLTGMVGFILMATILPILEAGNAL